MLSNQTYRLLQFYKSHIFTRSRTPHLFQLSGSSSRHFSTPTKGQNKIISDKMLKEIIQKSKQERQEVNKLLKHQSQAPKHRGQSSNQEFHMKAHVNELGEIDINYDEARPDDNYQKLEERAKKVEDDRFEDSKRMGDMLQFGDLTEAFAGYKSVNSPLRAKKKKKAKKTQKLEKPQEEQAVAALKDQLVGTKEIPEFGVQMEFEEAQHAKSQGKKKGKGKGKKKKGTNTYKASMVDEYSDVEQSKKIDLRTLNEQEKLDLKEIRELEKIADYREKGGVKGQDHLENMFLPDEDFMIDQEQLADEFIDPKTGQSSRSSSSKERFPNIYTAVNDIEIEYGEDNKPTILTETDFLSIYKIPRTMSIKIELRLPQFSLENFKAGQVQKHDIILDYDQIKKMNDFFQDYTHICAFTDGSSIRNPGRSGAGVVFMGKKKVTSLSEEINKDIKAIADDLSQAASKQEEEFMFGVCLHLGNASNNYAEYVGLILAQVFYSMFRQTNIQVYTDSQLVVTQVKGLAKIKNVRLVELVKITHALAYKFQSMGLDYIEREQNSLADVLAKEGSLMDTGANIAPYRVIFSLQKLFENVKIR